jgi:hypothetical protein
MTIQFGTYLIFVSKQNVSNDSNKFEKKKKVLFGLRVQVDRKSSARRFRALAELFDLDFFFGGCFSFCYFSRLDVLVGEFSDADGPAKADRFIFRLFLSSTPNTKLYREGGKQKTIVCFNVVYRRPTLHRTEKARTDTEDFKAAKKKKLRK